MESSEKTAKADKVLSDTVVIIEGKLYKVIYLEIYILKLYIKFNDISKHV